MKNINVLFLNLCILLIALTSTKLYSQATTGNFFNVPGAPTDYIGWTTGVNAPLFIKNEDNQQLHFYTNSGAGTFNNLKMRIGPRMRNNLENAAVMIQSRGINAILNPRAILQLGVNYGFVNGGWRLTHSSSSAGQASGLGRGCQNYLLNQKSFC